MTNFISKVLLIFSMIIGGSIGAMEQQSVKTFSEELAAIVPYSKSSFTFIPQYVYENCNQVTCHNWSSERFAELKATVSTMNIPLLVRQLFFNKVAVPLERIEALLKTAQGSALLEKPEFVTAAELLDWVYGLQIIENQYLSKSTTHLTISDLIRINACLSRMIANNEGNFRELSLWWPKKQLSHTEEAFVCTLGIELVRPSNPGYNLSRNELTIASAIQLAEYYNRHVPIVDIKSGKATKLDLEEIRSWEKECEILSGHTKNTIHIGEWVKTRVHHFPASREIVPLLNEALTCIKAVPMHPIEAASRIWFEIVRIHPWHEANKRTGKAIASLILLQNGYLPPLITKEDEEEYLKTLWQGFEMGAEGYLLFTRFIARMIIKTQAQAADLL